MAGKRIGLLALIAATLTGVAIAGIRSYCTRPHPLCGIQTYDYQYRPRSESAIAVSGGPLRLQRIVDHQLIKEIKRYQFDPAELTIDHCSISRMELQIHDNGVWVMNLKAEQNPEAEGEESPAVTEDGLYTAHLKRNQFVVKIRCYGGYGNNNARPQTATGRPVLFTLGPMEFWVQRGRPRYYWKEGYVNREKRLREMVDHVELEFFYR